MSNNNCNFQITTIKLKHYSRRTFKSDLGNEMNSKGKFLYRLYPNEELCSMTGFRKDVCLYIGKTTDLVDRLYRHFKGMCSEFEYSINMEKGRMLYDTMQVLHVPQYVLDNLYTYVEFEVDDLTETNVDLKCYEAENLKSFKSRHGFLPVLNKRVEKTRGVNGALARKFFMGEYA